MLPTDKYEHWKPGAVIKRSTGEEVEVMKHGQFELSSLGFDYHYLVRFNDGKLKHIVPNIGDIVCIGGTNAKKTESHVRGLATQLPVRDIPDGFNRARVSKPWRDWQRYRKTQAGIQEEAEEVVKAQGAYIVSPWHTRRIRRWQHAR